METLWNIANEYLFDKYNQGLIKSKNVLYHLYEKKIEKFLVNIYLLKNYHL